MLFLQVFLGRGPTSLALLVFKLSPCTGFAANVMIIIKIRQAAMSLPVVGLLHVATRDRFALSLTLFITEHPLISSKLIIIIMMM